MRELGIQGDSPPAGTGRIQRLQIRILHDNIRKGSDGVNVLAITRRYVVEGMQRLGNTSTVVIRQLNAASGDETMKALTLTVCDIPQPKQVPSGNLYSIRHL